MSAEHCVRVATRDSDRARRLAQARGQGALPPRTGAFTALCVEDQVGHQAVTASKRMTARDRALLRAALVSFLAAGLILTLMVMEYAR